MTNESRIYIQWGKKQLLQKMMLGELDSYMQMNQNELLSQDCFFFELSEVEFRGLLYFHTNFRIICSNSVKYDTEICIGITLNM